MDSHNQFLLRNMKEEERIAEIHREYNQIQECFERVLGKYNPSDTTGWRELIEAAAILRGKYEALNEIIPKL